MATAILMPKQGNTVEECILVAWKKNTGEKVEEGDVIADIETDKATFELKAPASGTIIGTFCEEGDLVPVLTNIGVIGKKGENIEPFRPIAQTTETKEVPAQSTSKSPAPQNHSAVPPSTTVAAPGTVAPAAPAPRISTRKFLSPRARKLADKYGVPVEAITGTGPDGRVVAADVKNYVQTAPRISSLARELLKKDYGMPVKGSGLNGMIRARDLKKPGIPLSNLRSIVARRMRASLLDAAQLTMTASAVAVPLLEARKQIKSIKGSPGFVDINLNDMIMYITIHTLKNTPELNAEFIDGKVYFHDDVDMAFACDTPKGLLVPVIRRAQTLTIQELALRLKSMAAEAQEGSISPDHLSGGSFTITNLGIMGIESFTPILNTPQVGILGVNTIGLKPVRTAKGIEFIDHIRLSLTIDHQAVDGNPGAKFLKTLVTNISTFKL